MKTKRFLITSLAALWAAGALSGQGLSPVQAMVDETAVVKAWNPGILGFNFDWTSMQSCVSNFALTNANWNVGAKGGLRADDLELLRGLPINISRMSGTSSQKLAWKDTLGPVSERPPQKLESWWGPFVPGYGVVEWIEQVRILDDKARFVWCVNLLADPSDAADLAEFFGGEANAKHRGQTDWAALRKSLGIAKPVDIFIWELGNESDGNDAWEHYPTIQTYIDKCRAVMKAVRSVNPKARFAAQVSTMNHQKTYKEKYGGEWDIWHKTVLKELGGEIDYLTYHPYFGKKAQPDTQFFEKRMELIAKDIREITGSDRIKIFMSEYGFWPEKKEGQAKWEESWPQTHALLGSLSTADWIVRMIQSPVVEVATVHSYSGGPWGVFYNSQRDDLGKTTPSAPFTTGQFVMYQFMNEAFAGAEKVIPLNLSGDKTDRLSKEGSFTGAAATTAEGLTLVFVNQDANVERHIQFTGKKKYVLKSQKIFTGDSLDSRNDSKRKEIRVESRPGSDGEFKEIVIPARSLVALQLKKI